MWLKTTSGLQSWNYKYKWKSDIKDKKVIHKQQRSATANKPKAIEFKRRKHA